MKDNCLYRVVPVLKEINEDSRVQLERYFSTAPDWLLKSIIVEEVPAGTVFIREGEPADTIYFVANGTIKATDYRIFGIPYDFMMIRKKVYAYGGREVIMEIGRYQATIQTVDRCLVPGFLVQILHDELGFILHCSEISGKPSSSWSICTRKPGTAEHFSFSKDRIVWRCCLSTGTKSTLTAVCSA